MSASSYCGRMALGFVLSLTASVAIAAPKWLKLESPNVVIYSDASTKDVVEYAVGYAAFRAAFQQVLAPPVRVPRPTVLLFRDRDKLQEKLPKPGDGKQTLTFSAPIDGAILIGMSVEGDRSEALAQTYQFETIFGLQRCGYNAPLWMAQGAGEVLESMELEKGKYEIGDSGAYAWPADTVPWPRFFEINSGSPEYSGPKARGDYHRQAWALMHRVLLGGGSSSQNFARLAQLVAEKGPLAGTEAYFGIPADGFKKDIKAHLSKHVRQSYPFDADALRKTLTPVPAPEVEVDVQLSNLLFAAGKENEGELELGRAGYIAADSIAVKEARARRALRHSDWLEGAELYRAAIALGSNNPIAYLRSAQERLGIRPGSRIQAGGAGELANTAIEEIHHALQLDPGNPEAYALLGKALYLAPEMHDADIDELSRGVAAGAVGAAVRYSRALVYSRQEKTAEAIADLRAILAEPYADPALKDVAAQMMIDVAFRPVAKEVEALVRDEKFTEAKGQIADARRDQTNPTVIARLDDLEKWLDEQTAWAGVVKATEAGDEPLAGERAKSFLEKFPRSRAAGEAKRLVHNAEQAAAAK